VKRSTGRVGSSRQPFAGLAEGVGGGIGEGLGKAVTGAVGEADAVGAWVVLGAGAKVVAPGVVVGKSVGAAVPHAPRIAIATSNSRDVTRLRMSPLTRQLDARCASLEHELAGLDQHEDDEQRSDDEAEQE
jgi:hypothetical protein